MPNKKTIVVGHKYTTTPEDYLTLYLKDLPDTEVMQITHAYGDSKNRVSSFSIYTDSKVSLTGTSLDFFGKPELLIYLKEFIFTIKSVIKSKRVWDTCIAIDGLCTTFCIFLRILGKVDKVVYWAMDFVPSKRFHSKIKNYIYKRINTFAYRNANEVWDLSPRMAEARERYWGLTSESYESTKVVPYGVWVKNINKYNYSECEQNTLVFMGHLLEKQGVQHVIEAIPNIIQKNEKFMFKIIGGGEYLEALKQLADKLRVTQYCIFTGKLENHSQLEEEIAKSCVAIAPYSKKLDTWTYYADPGKVKEYLAAGVPVLLTDLPWNAKEIVDHKCGEIITTEINDITDKVLKLFNPEINQTYRNNAVKYAQRFDYSEIFNKLLLDESI